MIKTPFPGRRMTIQESNAWIEKICEIKQSIKNIFKARNTFGDAIKISEEYLFWEGSQEQVKNGSAKLMIKSKGHIVNYGLAAIVNLLSYSGNSNNYYNRFGTVGFATGTPVTTQAYVKVGTGAGATGPTTTTLTTVNNTLPSSQAGNTSNPTAGTYRISYIATWNSGALAAITVSEVGLWLAYLTAGSDMSALQAFGWSFTGNTMNGQSIFFSRLSDADGDFTAFTVNTAVPLTIEWRLTFSFA
jgi:hypothetical protein